MKLLWEKMLFEESESQTPTPVFVTLFSNRVLLVALLSHRAYWLVVDIVFPFILLLAEIWMPIPNSMFEMLLMETVLAVESRRVMP